MKKKAIIISIICCLAVIAGCFILSKTTVSSSSAFNRVVDEMTFDNILGHKGCCTVRAIEVNGEKIDDWREYVFYYHDSDTQEIIAYCCGYERPVCVDIDNDGLCELICNSETHDGDRKTLYIYKNADGQILRGTVDLEACKTKGYLDLKSECRNIDTSIDLLLWKIDVTYRDTKARHIRGFSLNNFDEIVYSAWDSSKIAL